MADGKTPAFNKTAGNTLRQKISALYDMTDPAIDAATVRRQSADAVQLAEEIYTALAMKAGEPLEGEPLAAMLADDRKKNPVADYGVMLYSQLQLDGFRTWARGQLEQLQNNTSNDAYVQYLQIGNARAALKQVAVLSDRLMTRKPNDVKPAKGGPAA